MLSSAWEWSGSVGSLTHLLSEGAILNDVVLLAFIEKLLDLDTAHNYRIVTCGEETHCKYPCFETVSCTNVCCTQWLIIESLSLNTSNTGISRSYTSIPVRQSARVHMLSAQLISCDLTADWYAKQDPALFSFHVGESVASLDHASRSVTTDKGRTIAYDYCVLATGSDAALPSYADLSIPGAFVYRNISDVNKLLEYAEKGEMKDCSVNPKSTHASHKY